MDPCEGARIPGMRLGVSAMGFGVPRTSTGLWVQGMGLGVPGESHGRC